MASQRVMIILPYLLLLLLLLLHHLPHCSVHAATISGSNSSRNDAGHRDIDCLKSIKSSFLDPSSPLTSTWDFANGTNTGLCGFPGIDCWHLDDNKVHGIDLPNMALAGEFPRGLENCDSINTLNLSGNNLSGPIPVDIGHVLPFLTILDLSNNNLSGEIPASLFNCSYLNVVRLDKNRLTGRIPDGLQQLARLKKFNVSGNLLSGPIPGGLGIWAGSAGSFGNNSGLCGLPLDPCSPPDEITSASQFRSFFMNGFVVGFAVVEVFVLTYVYWFCIRYPTVAGRRKKEEAGVWVFRPVADYGRGRNVKISVLETLVTRMSFKELSEATSNFSPDNIIGTGTTGTVYKAVLPNGWFLAVKRLNHPAERFIPEVMTLGRWRHKNLLPLLGFCIHNNNEKLLVYKFMSNGNLHDRLLRDRHQNDNDKCCLDWPSRFKIAVGLARGLAWLHHCCSVQIFHLNLTSKCVLLDHGFEPQLSNFGRAMFVNPGDHNQSRDDHLVLDKGFLELGFAKKDVRSFGVVVLELIGGREVRGETTSVDECVAGKGYDWEIGQVMRVARDCVQPMAAKRPTMLQVVQRLNRIGQGWVGDGEEGYQPVVVPSVVIEMGQDVGSKYR